MSRARQPIRGLPSLYDPEVAAEETEPDVGSRIRSFFDGVLREIEAEERGEEEAAPTRRFYRSEVV